MVSADMGRSPSGMLPNMLTSSGALCRGAALARPAADMVPPSRCINQTSLLPGSLLAQRAVSSAVGDDLCGSRGRRQLMTAACSSSGGAQSRGPQGNSTLILSEKLADSTATPRGAADGPGFPLDAASLAGDNDTSLGGLREEVAGASTWQTHLSSIGEGGELSSDDASSTIGSSDDAAAALKPWPAAVSAPGSLVRKHSRSLGHSRWTAGTALSKGGGGLTEDFRAASMRLADDHGDVCDDGHSDTNSSNSSGLDNSSDESQVGSDDEEAFKASSCRSGGSHSHSSYDGGAAAAADSGHRISFADGFGQMQNSQTRRQKSRELLAIKESQNLKQHTSGKTWPGFAKRT